MAGAQSVRPCGRETSCLAQRCLRRAASASSRQVAITSASTLTEQLRGAGRVVRKTARIYSTRYTLPSKTKRTFGNMYISMEPVNDDSILLLKRPLSILIPRSSFFKLR